jgi:hypothetical protein
MLHLLLFIVRISRSFILFAFFCSIFGFLLLFLFFLNNLLFML